MDGYALGLIEIKGKLAALEAADTALKSANVALCGFENATGALITVKVVGDVGAVRAAVMAARARASLKGEVLAVSVLPRPAQGILPLLRASDACAGFSSSAEAGPLVKVDAKPLMKVEVTPLMKREVKPEAKPEVKPGAEAEAGPDRTPQKAKAKASASDAPDKTAPKAGAPDDASGPDFAPESAAVTPPPPAAEKKAATAEKSASAATCNICGDPVCPRVKGDPARNCLHAKKRRPK